MAIYGGDGHDKIYNTDFASGGNGAESIESTGDNGLISGTYDKKKKEAYFKVSSTSNAITLKDFSATSFNVNGSNYKISGSKLVKK